MRVVRSGSGGTAPKMNSGEPVTVAALARQHNDLVVRVGRCLRERAPVWYPEIRALHAVCRALIVASKASKQSEYAPLARDWADEATVLAQAAQESRV